MTTSQVILFCLVYLIMGLGFSKAVSRSHDINTPAERFWFTVAAPIIAAIMAFCSNWEK